MKKKNIKIWIGGFLMLLAASSCEDQLNINENPNSAITAEVQLVLPQAIVATAAISNQFNSYGAHFGGYMSNAGGFSGFGNLLNYNLTPSDWNGLWVNSYQDALQDLKYVMDNSEGKGTLAYYGAAAKILTVVNYQRLVDAFGDIPYSEALRAGEGIVAPAYDDAATIYKDLFAKLDEAIAEINAANVATSDFPLRLTKSTDPLFGELAAGDVVVHMKEWQKYANTLKLRILLRLNAKPEFGAFVTEGFSKLDLALGFLTDDAIVDPGYELNRPNPEWATWGRTPALALANSSRIPTPFAFGFYGGAKIKDTERGEASFVNYPLTPINQLGNENAAPTIVSNTVTWAANQVPPPTGGNRRDYTGLGILKGAGMGQPLMLAAESHFLQAEAKVRNLLAGGNTDAGISFNNGIKASIAYLFKDENEALKDTAKIFTSYRVENAGNDLVIWEEADDNQNESIEAIITQKYIALNMINSDEAWNEYRRTGFPLSLAGNTNAALDIASNKSTVSRPDKMPTRILYPSSEQSFNSSNFRVIDYTSQMIFWDPN